MKKNFWPISRSIKQEIALMVERNRAYNDYLVVKAIEAGYIIPKYGFVNFKKPSSIILDESNQTA